jgi:hypothetical protein
MVNRARVSVEGEDSMNIYNAEIALEARHFHGTENWYKHLFGIVYTDGVQWLAETLNCYWLIDEVAFNTRLYRKSQSFMTVGFKTLVQGKGSLEITNGNDYLLAKRRYEFTDLFVNTESLKAAKETEFIRFFLVYGGDFKRHVLMLPSEY